MSSNYITLEDFSKLDIRIGKVLKAEQIPGSRKLIRLEVDIGGEVRQLVAGIGDRYRPDELVGKKVVVLTNIQPKRIFGVLSQGMLLAADVDGKPYLLTVDTPDEVPVGAKVR
ncbi:MAG: methionine--tRNA ligase subunit beta [Thermoprotei archaeon]|nr:MAG: methionine--tRNA ligase subunit beta [Thermoprotei archaeon]